ncbi:hypothetical protein VTJ04DRAFT_939 [Mycothermus thermophilus]|uniref:uncharacterized protein n=1 Tax=Humicola insolens TaxID=85995 RepID=UPI003742A5D2
MRSASPTQNFKSNYNLEVCSFHPLTLSGDQQPCVILAPTPPLSPTCPIPSQPNQVVGLLVGHSGSNLRAWAAGHKTACFVQLSTPSGTIEGPLDLAEALCPTEDGWTRRLTDDCHIKPPLPSPPS